jgi:hypothetical protein
MGYNPKIWGPEAWHFIHFVALNYPINPTEDDKRRYNNFFHSLQYTLPCEGCAYNFGEKLKKHPPKLESRKSLFEWTVDIHNEVNESNGKKKLTYEEAIRKIDMKQDLKILKESFAITSFGLLFILFNFLVFRD